MAYLSVGTLLYTWGAGYHGQLGLANNSQRKKCMLQPSWIEFKEPVLQVACGGFHTTVLTDTGRVYTWGDGRSGQLGNLARKHNMHSTPHLVDHLVNIKTVITQISCGQYHTACVSSNGLLLTWGSGKYGQLGHSTRLDMRYPKVVEADKHQCGKFKMSSCGDRHTAAITESGRVVTFGSGQHGQLGHGDGDDSLKPHVVEALVQETMIQVDSGATHTAAISDTGVLYLWGFGESLHPKEFSNIVDSPRVVKMKQSVKQVACGQSHVLVLTTNGDVYAFGNARMGQIGHGSKTSVRTPRLVLRGKNIYEVAAGRYHSMAVSGYGVLYSWGCGESGQLAHNSLKSEFFPRIVDSILPNVVGQISCGEHHSFCLSSIEHSAISPDVLRWKMIEEEELKLKKLMIMDSPNGLKTKHVLQVEQERARIIHELDEKLNLEKQMEGKHLKDQLTSIRTRRQLEDDVHVDHNLAPDSERREAKTNNFMVDGTATLAIKDGSAADDEKEMVSRLMSC